MKTKLKIVLFVTVLLSLVFFKMNTVKNHNLTLANVEALASGEGGYYMCLMSGSVDCPISNVKVYRVTL